MPIYMDRHDVSELVTAENVAQLHKEDLKVQSKFNCRGLTYWFDDIKKIAFCLIEAPNAESIRLMHNHAHGEVPNQVIEVDPKLVESFLGRIEDPYSQNELNIINDPAQRTLLTIRFTPFNEGIKTRSSLKVTLQKVGDLFKLHEGRLVKRNDGYLLISFKSVYHAVQCALEIRTKFDEFEEKLGHFHFDSNIGLAIGLPVNNNKALFEDTINLANSLCFIDGKEIVISKEVEKAFKIESPDNIIKLDCLKSISLLDEIFLNKLLCFIEEEWQNIALKVEDFSSSLGMSKTLIYKKMILLTGKSPNSFLREYRLNKALELLNLKMKTISEIAFDCGFNSTSYFSKCFQKRFNILPSAYIKA